MNAIFKIIELEAMKRYIDAKYLKITEGPEMSSTSDKKRVAEQKEFIDKLYNAYMESRFHEIEIDFYKNASAEIKE